LELFTLGFLPVSVIDLIDVMAVTFIFYQIYLIMRGTRATQMFAGLLFLLAAGSVAQLAGMSGLTWLIQSIGTVWVIAFVILFQQELRRMLLQVGQIGLLRNLFRSGGEKTIGEAVAACVELSKRRYGGLIVFQRSTGIRGVVETGVPLQAEISRELLVSLFIPRTPLHDGAVIVVGDTIVAARCILPLTTQAQVDPSLGTRHRAALGITEEVDAVTVVVSEESGSISIAVNGKFTARNLDERGLKTELTRLLYPRARDAEASAAEVSPAASGV